MPVGRPETALWREKGAGLGPGRWRDALSASGGRQGLLHASAGARCGASPRREGPGDTLRRLCFTCRVSQCPDGRSTHESVRHLPAEASHLIPGEARAGHGSRNARSPCPRFQPAGFARVWLEVAAMFAGFGHVSGFVVIVCVLGFRGSRSSRWGQGSDRHGQL